MGAIMDKRFGLDDQHLQQIRKLKKKVDGMSMKVDVRDPEVRRGMCKAAPRVQFKSDDALKAQGRIQSRSGLGNFIGKPMGGIGKVQVQINQAAGIGRQSRLRMLRGGQDRGIPRHHQCQCQCRAVSRIPIRSIPEPNLERHGTQNHVTYGSNPRRCSIQAFPKYMRCY